MKQPLDLFFLGSGNAFAAEGRAFSSFLLNGRYLFDCGPTLLQQLSKSGRSTRDIDAIFISHFHADHFFGLPFFLLDAKYSGRDKPVTIVGPPGIEQQTERLIALGYRTELAKTTFTRNYREVEDGVSDEVADLRYSAARVEHVEALDCFAYRAEADGRAVVYSGDAKLCGGLLRLVQGADVVVLECSCKGVEVHLSPEGVQEVTRHAGDANVIVTHLDGAAHPNSFEGLIVAEDLGRYRF
jgi:ribonuclease BN (tRNA processing enzyme)